MENFGMWVRQEREARHLTATECARRAGMKLTAWSRMERTVKHPQRDTCASVARGLGVEEAVVLRAAGYAVEEDLDVGLARRLNRVLRSLPADERQRIAALLEQDASQYVKLLKPYLGQEM